jgi:hypothetical protein
MKMAKVLKVSRRFKIEIMKPLEFPRNSGDDS